jgi:hypothetical protein
VKRHTHDMADRFRRLIAYDPLAGLHKKKRAQGGQVVKRGGRWRFAEGGPVDDAPDVQPAKENFQPVINDVARQYPGLQPYTKNLTVQRGSTTDPNDDRQLEFYQPWDSDNPNPGKITSELYNKNLTGQDLTETIAGDMLHHLGTTDPSTGQPVDPKWMAMKQQMIAGMGPDQASMNQEAYQQERANTAYQTGPYDDWMNNNRADAYIRGALFPNQNPEWQQPGTYTPAMQQTAAAMRAYLANAQNRRQGGRVKPIKRASGGKAALHPRFTDFRRSDNIEDRRNDRGPVPYHAAEPSAPWIEEQKAATMDDNPLSKDLGILNVYDKHARGGRIHKAGGGAMSDDDMGITTAAPKAMSDADMGIGTTQPAAPKTWSDRLSNMWDKATPGGPLWLVKQAVTSVPEVMDAEKASDAQTFGPGPSSVSDTDVPPQMNTEALGQAAGKVASVFTPGAPGGTGGLLAAPLRAAEKIVNPIVQGNKAAASEFGIDLSRGQSAQDLDAIRYEDMASRGAYGKDQQDRAAGFFNKQHQDIEAGGQSVGQQTARAAPVVDNPAEAADTLSSEIFDRAARLRAAQGDAERQATAESETQRSMVSDQGRALNEAIQGGALPIENPREAGEIVGQNVRDTAAQNRDEYRGLYSDFGQRQGEYRIDAVQGLGNRIRNDLTFRDEPVIVDEGTPTAMRAVAALDQMSEPRITNLADPRAAPNPDEISGVSIQGIAQMRKRLTAMEQQARGSNNPSDVRAVQAIKNAFDEQIQRAHTEGLYSGDPEAPAVWRAAMDSFSRYRQNFTPRGQGDDVGAAMRRIVERNATPEETANMIIGSGKLGSAGLPVRLADRLEHVLGADSDAWSVLRQAMWRKASQVRNSAGEIDPARSAAAINDFTGSTLAQRMFTGQERAAMRAHAQGIRDLDRNIEQLPAVQNSTRARQAYQDTFGGAELGGAPRAVFQRMVEGTATPEEITNSVFKVIGAGNPGHVTRALQAIERIVGPDSEAMAAVRQGVWQKLVQGTSGKEQSGAQKKLTAIDQFLNGVGKTIAEQLYSPKELALMQRYANAIKLTIIPPKAATRSDTAVASFAAARKYAGMLGAALGWVHGDGGLTGYAVGKLLDKAGEKVTGIKDMRKLNDSLDNIDPTLAHSTVIGKHPMPSRAVRKEAPFSLGLPSSLQGPVPAGANDEQDQSKRIRH